MDPLFLLALITVFVVILFDYMNGFHDAANIVATVIASRAMTPAQAVILVGIFEFLGPLLGGTAVANTIGKFIDLSDVKPLLARALRHPGPVVLDIPIDYRENDKLAVDLWQLAPEELA